MLIEFLVIVISNKEIHQMANPVYKPITKNKNLKKNPKKDSKKKNLPKTNFDFFDFFLQKRPETESRNSGDHELWNHEMQGSPVCHFVHLEKDMIPE